MAMKKQRTPDQIRKDEIRAARASVRRWQAARDERAAQVRKAGGTEEQVALHCKHIDECLEEEKKWLANLL